MPKEEKVATQNLLIDKPTVGLEMILFPCYAIIHKKSTINNNKKSASMMG
jgi:hypothetical protein